MTSNPPENLYREVKKRPRPVISCLQCRQKKLKCDRLLPCQQCVKGGRTQLCSYAEGQDPERRADVDDVDTNPAKRIRSSHHESSSAILTTPGQVDEVLDRLKSLEKALQSQQGKFQQGETLSPGQYQGPNEAREDILEGWKGDKRSISNFPIASQFIRSLPMRHNDTELVHIARQTRDVQQCLQQAKRHGRGSHSDAESCLNHMLRILPEKGVCESLISLYFENFEHCNRILHKPTFIQQYRDSVLDHLPAKNLHTFIPLLIGVLLVASSLNTLEECHQPVFCGERDGIGAAQLLQNWVDLQSADDRFTISTLQVRLLLMVAMKLQGQDDRALWTTSGQLLRDSMVIGLHSPPHDGVDILTKEVRKRLWMTILELDFAHAMCLGLPANIPSLLPDQIPINANDDELSTSTKAARPTDEWTDGLCQHVLGQTFNARLDAYNYIFQNEPLKYSETLSKAKQLEHFVFALPSTFKFDHNNPPGRLLAQMEVDISLRRPLIALYTPFALVMPIDDHFKDARIGWVQANLVILCFQDLFDPKFPAIEVPRPEGYWDLYYTVYKNDDYKALHAEALELQRMRDPLHNNVNGTSPGLQQHPHRSGSRALGWTIKGMEESIEDTLDPLIRRIGRQGADFDTVLRYQLVFDSLRGEDHQTADSCIRTGLTTILQTVRAKLEREGHYIDTEPSTSIDALSWSQDLLQWFQEFLSGEDLISN